MSSNGKVGLDRDVRRQRVERAGPVRRRDEAKGGVGHPPGDGEQEVEVPMRVRADRDDVDVRGLVARPEGHGVDAERDELDRRARPSRPQPPSDRLRLVLAVGEDRGCGAERTRVEALHAARPEPCQPLGQADRDVDEGHAHRPRTGEQDERDADGVDGRENDVGPAQGAERRKHGREVAAVPPGRFEAPLPGPARDPRPRRGGGSLEVVSHDVPAGGEVVHSVERVPRGGARLERERGATLRRVAEEVEDGGHRLRR